MVDCTPEPSYEGYSPVIAVHWLAEPIKIKRKKVDMPFGFTPTSGGKPSKGTPADKRLSSNKPKSTPKPRGK